MAGKIIKEENINNLITYVETKKELYDGSHGDFKTTWDTFGLLLIENGADCAFTWKELEKSYATRDSTSPFAKYFNSLTFLDDIKLNDSIDTNVSSSNHDESSVLIDENTPVAKSKTTKQKKEPPTFETTYNKVQKKLDNFNKTTKTAVRKVLEENNTKISREVLELLNELKAMTLNSASGGASTSNPTV